MDSIPLFIFIQTSFLQITGVAAEIPFSVVLSCIAMMVMILFSGLVSAAEIGFFSLTEKEFNVLREKGDRTSKTIIALLSKPRHLLATLLICNNMVNIAIVILSYFIFSQTFDFSAHPLLGFLVNVMGVTLFIVLFGEVLPKVYATRHNVQVATLMAIPVSVAGKIFKPLSYLLVSSTRLIEKRLSKTGYREFNPEELEQAIDLTAGDKSSRQEVKMLKGIVRFSNITVRQIMRQRMDVVAVDDSVTFPDLVKIVTEAGYSRIPVYRDNLDNVIGILYVKDLLDHLNQPADFKWHRLLRPPVFTPHTKRVDTLLREIQKKGVHLIIAVDEYGGTSGIITLEDILEEVIGEIRDEYDALEEEPYFEKIDSKNFVFDGKTPLQNICNKMNLKNEVFDEVRGEADTLAGLILELSGKMPVKNDEFRHDNFTFKVVSVGDNRIKRVLITVTDDVYSEN